MLNGSTIGGIRAIFAASCFLVTHASAQEYYDVMSGRMPTSTSSMMFSYGANPTTAFPPRAPSAIRPRFTSRRPFHIACERATGAIFRLHREARKVRPRPARIFALPVKPKGFREAP